LRAAGAIGLLTLAKSNVRPAPTSGSNFLSEFFSFDREIQQFMSARKVPGGALAVVKDGRLVYTRGYGWADRENKVPVKPTSLFRIASISKPFTAVAVLKLLEAGKLGLNAHVFELLGLGAGVLLPPGGKLDERWKQITVRHLLNHTGGWDRDKSFDPMFRSRQIAAAFGVPSPPAPSVIIRYMLGKPLDFDPGTRYAYSNFGFCLLGRVIEKITGSSYESYVREKVLAPIGIKRMRIGASLAEKRAESEVHYYTPSDETTRSVFDNSSGSRRAASNPPPTKDGSRRAGTSVPSSEGSGSATSPGAEVPWPYGGFCQESMDAHGGWIASAVDLVRFAVALRDSHHSPLLKPETIQSMYLPPEPPVSRKDDGSLKDSYYACGWSVRPVGTEGKANYWHTGSLPGTYTMLVRRHDGVSWAILFNQRTDDKKLPDSEIDPALHRAANAVNVWPKFDLFAQYKSTL